MTEYDMYTKETDSLIPQPEKSLGWWGPGTAAWSYGCHIPGAAQGQAE